jgi:hypothetical protein
MGKLVNLIANFIAKLALSHYTISVVYAGQTEETVCLPEYHQTEKLLSHETVFPAKQQL